MTLLRLDPATGQIVSVAKLSSLMGQDEVWLRTLDDGRMLLAASTGNSHRLAILSSLPFSQKPVAVDGCRHGGGRLLTAPVVRGLRVYAAIARKKGGTLLVSPEEIADFAGAKKGGSCGLLHEL